MVNTSGKKKEKVRFTRILLPLDGSKLGEAALPYIESLAIDTKAEVVLLQVVTPLSAHLLVAEGYLSQTADKYIAMVSRTAKNYLDAVKERLMKLEIPVRCEVEAGSPAEKIISYAKENNINLIAMSTHGHSGISRWLIGSVADKVLHATDIPVLLVRATEK